METPATGRTKRQTSYEFYKNLFKLTIGGGVVFWVITFAISLSPIAAEYRAAESISNIQAVWVGGLLVGLIIGWCISYFLLRFFDKIPTKNPILKSVVLSFIAFVIAMILLEAPASFRTSDALYYLLIGVIFNVPRFLFVGIVIGYLYKMLYKGSNPAVVASKSPQVDS
jgi:NhaP-type Na+/H+ or K+/H+ antiporter